MKKTNSHARLEDLISTKEAEYKIEGEQLRVEFHHAFNSLKPGNLIKSAFNDAISVPDLKNKVVNNAVGYASGFFARKMVVGKTHGVLPTILGMVIERTVANQVTNNFGLITSVGKLLFSKIFAKRNMNK